MSAGKCFVKSDEKLIATHNSLFLICNQESEPAFLANIVIDISEQEQMEAELLKIRKLESVGVLAGGIAHDFNNILAAILGNIQLASLLVGKEHKAFKLLSDAQKASSRAARLTQQLLTFAKGGSPVKETTSLSQLIQDLASFVLHGSPVFCNYDFQKDLWLVDIDAGQMSQVIQNLIINARQAMQEGGSIDIQCMNVQNPAAESLVKLPAGSFVKVIVRDRGTGIPDKLIDKIFDPYFSTKKNGSGLGLSICHSIITKHDGYISVQSPAGQGTTFCFYLPASKEQRHHVKTEPQVSNIKKPLKIMVMDDEEMLKDIASSLLEHLGHKVILVNDGNEAINSYRELQDTAAPVDLIIMDLTIPGGMGGKEAVQGILKRYNFPASRVLV